MGTFTGKKRGASSFTGDLVTKWRDDDTFEVYTPYRFDFGELGSGVGAYIEQGTVTDLMSLPWLARLIIRRTTSGSIASVPHDKIYQTGRLDKYTINPDEPTNPTPMEFHEPMKIGRGIADLVILDAMLTRKMSRVVAYFVYVILVCFGWIAWSRCREAEKLMGPK